jgi:L-amino acid N-acyltransferase YncA
VGVEEVQRFVHDPERPTAAPGETRRRAMEEKRVTLKDGSEVLLRPMRSDDLERSYAFFEAIPSEDRGFLRVDVTRREQVAERIRLMDAGQVRRLVAVVDDRIVADGALELSGHGWKEHVAEIRLIVGVDHRRKGLGMLMARELYLLAAAEKVEQVVVKMMRPQHAAHDIFRRLGFSDQALLPEYVKDRSGRRQDLILMRCDLQAMWKRLEDYLQELDWQRTR